MGQYGAHMGPTLAPWSLLSGKPKSELWCRRQVAHHSPYHLYHNMRSYMARQMEDITRKICFDNLEKKLPCYRGYAMIKQDIFSCDFHDCLNPCLTHDYETTQHFRNILFGNNFWPHFFQASSCSRMILMQAVTLFGIYFYIAWWSHNQFKSNPMNSANKTFRCSLSDHIWVLQPIYHELLPVFLEPRCFSVSV